jgi:hypothetical protein
MQAIEELQSFDEEKKAHGELVSHLFLAFHFISRDSFRRK